MSKSTVGRIPAKRRLAGSAWRGLGYGMARIINMAPHPRRIWLWLRPQPPAPCLARMILIPPAGMREPLTIYFTDAPPPQSRAYTRLYDDLAPRFCYLITTESDSYPTPDDWQRLTPSHQRI